MSLSVWRPRHHGGCSSSPLRKSVAYFVLFFIFSLTLALCPCWSESVSRLECLQVCVSREGNLRVWVYFFPRREIPPWTIERHKSLGYDLHRWLFLVFLKCGRYQIFPFLPEVSGFGWSSVFAVPPLHVFSDLLLCCLIYLSPPRYIFFPPSPFLLLSPSPPTPSSHCLPPSLVTPTRRVTLSLCSLSDLFITAVKY